MSTRKRCGWFCRNWKKVAGAVATIIAGPIVGGIVSAALAALPEGQGQKSSSGEFSPRVETALDMWANGKFNTWYLNKFRIFKTKTTLASLLDASTLSQVNRTILEMASFVKYYEYMATQKGDAELYNAKAIVMQDALTEFSQVYQTAINSLNGVIYVNRINVRTTNVLGGPDVMQWSGKSFTIAVPSFSRKPQTVSNLPTQGQMTLPPLTITEKPMIDKPVYEIPVYNKPIIRPSANVPLPARPETAAINCLIPPCPQIKPSVMVIKPNTQDAGSVAANSEITTENTPKAKISKSKILKVVAVAVVAGVAIKSLT